ncbi:MAG: DUF3343 domain-containing protein [Candidatus Cloacimonadales bacterium]|nr:DUF3343 domain-containing protein [Candidatus Cloacimonadales bacterium]
MKADFIITFLSSHHAIKAEKSFMTGKFAVELIPTPRPISSECGFTLFAKNEIVEKIKDFLKQKKLSFAGIYKIEYSNGEKRYEKID